MYWLPEDELPLAIIEKKNGRKEIVLQEDDWNKVEIKMISELFVSNQVIFLQKIYYLLKIFISRVPLILL